MKSDIDALRAGILSPEPTKQQEHAIFSDDLEFFLRAAPGSGKTWTSSRRFIWRAATSGHRVGGLALLSFTNAAVKEFQSATIEAGRSDLISDPNYVGTFDAFVERFLITPFGHRLKQSSIRPRLLTMAPPFLKKIDDLAVWVQFDSGKRPVMAWDLVPFLKDGKAAFRTVNSLGAKEVAFADINPVEELLRRGYYTHQHRVYWACRLLKDFPHICRVLARRFPEVIVDEAQDCNQWLLVLLNRLRKEGTKITLVGDPDQCIYEFAMADVTSLNVLREKWKVPEKPLNLSFRCSHDIANAVRNISGNHTFVGRSGDERDMGVFIVRDDPDRRDLTIRKFTDLVESGGIEKADTAILCRAHSQLQEVRGQARFEGLQGVTKMFARAAFERDCLKDYRSALKKVNEALRAITADEDLWKIIEDDPECETAESTRYLTWQFLKSHKGLPPVSLAASDWIEALRINTEKALSVFSIKKMPSLKQKLRGNGLEKNQKELPLFEDETLFPAIRHQTIHQVKGESIDAVLLLGSLKFFNSVVSAIEKGINDEDRRLAYVGMTRARHLLVVGLPAAHFDKHSGKWKSWGFKEL